MNYTNISINIYSIHNCIYLRSFELIKTPFTFIKQAMKQMTSGQFL